MNARESVEKERPPAPRPCIDARLRLRLYDGETPVFGPGVYRLLVRVADAGSLNQAAQEMGMAYSKAWRIVGDAERHLGVELLERRAGGAGGGGSALTAAGVLLVDRYARLLRDLEDAVTRLYPTYFADQPFFCDRSGRQSG